MANRTWVTCLSLMAVAVITASVPSAIFATPTFGPSIFVGSSTTRYDLPNVSLDASGSIYGLDLQIPVGESLSINPFVEFGDESSGETVIFTGTPIPSATTTSYEISIYGAQVRYWPAEDVFFGVHLADYTVRLILPQVKQSESDHALGFGAAVGWEADFGLGATLQYDSADIDGLVLSALRILIGWRLSL